MSYGMMEFYSTVLGRNAEFRFILPDDARARRDMFKDSPAYRRPTKTIYLLNGYSNSSTEWLLGGNIRFCLLYTSRMDRLSSVPAAYGGHTKCTVRILWSIPERKPGRF